ncbi:M48 family metallopeptidase [soil metagenome]
MLSSNPWFWVALVATIGLYKLELWAAFLNLSALSPTIPERLSHSINEEEHEQMLEYTRISAKFDVIQSSVSLAFFLTFWWIGGFSVVDDRLRSLHLGDLQTGLLTIAVVFFAQTLLSLPFEVYDTFFIEAQFGFNKTTVTTFIKDRIKGLMLAVVLGTPLLSLLLWLFQNVSYATAYGWVCVTTFSLLMSFLAPRLILPLFYKFKPLEEPSLREAIMKMGNRLQFPVGEISIVDGSSRSSKANAFFTGFGRTKRIALFDTLLNNHTQDEILAVLAHEIGHCKRRHVPKQLILSLGTTAIMFALLQITLHDAGICAAFGVNAPTIAWHLIFFSILYQPVSLLIGLLGSWLSRKYEFEADAFAREAMETPEPLASALIKLTRDHLGNPTPHPFYVFLNYSHPTTLQRLTALGA